MQGAAPELAALCGAVREARVPTVRRILHDHPALATLPAAKRGQLPPLLVAVELADYKVRSPLLPRFLTSSLQRAVVLPSNEIAQMLCSGTLADMPPARPSARRHPFCLQRRTAVPLPARLETLQCFLDCDGVDFGVRIGAGWTAAHYAAEQWGEMASAHMPLARQLLQRVATALGSLEDLSPEGGTALHIAAANDSMFAEALLAEGADKR